MSLKNKKKIKIKKNIGKIQPFRQVCPAVKKSPNYRKQLRNGEVTPETKKLRGTMDPAPHSTGELRNNNGCFLLVNSSVRYQSERINNVCTQCIYM